MYRVTRKADVRASESAVGNFSDEKKATAEIQKLLTQDNLYNLKFIYTLYEGYDAIRQFDQNDLQSADDSSTGSSTDQQSSGGKGTGHSFSPSPLPTSPRPPGMPASSWKRNDNEGDDKDKK